MPEHPSEHILLTGGAGFIGSHVAARLLGMGMKLTVIDNFDDYYDPALKEKNISALISHPGFRLIRENILSDALPGQLSGDYDTIIHLAAKVGVRPGIIHPREYNAVNAEGTLKMLEFARNKKIVKFILASSSSVYGTNPDLPWKESAAPVAMQSPYAVSKRAAELYAYAYSAMAGIHTTVLRLFTVYGPGQRPDLVIHRFADALLKNEVFQIYGDGSMSRDYTYIDDVAEAFCRTLQCRHSGFEIINIGNRNPVSLNELVACMEKVFGKKALVQYCPRAAGDVPYTAADTRLAKEILGFEPSTTLEYGLEKFRKWTEKQSGTS